MGAQITTAWHVLAVASSITLLPKLDSMETDASTLQAGTCLACNPLHPLCVTLVQAGNDVAGQGSEEALATPRSLGGGDSEPDEGTCAICLDRTPVEEVALVKGCEHSYCGEPPLWSGICCPEARASPARLPSLIACSVHDHTNVT